MSKKFIYGIAEVRYKKKDGTTKDKVGYIEKGSWDWGGTKPESIDVEAEQVPDAPVFTLLQSNGKISPTFNLIQLDFENLQRALGGTLIESGTGQDRRSRDGKLRHRLWIFRANGRLSSYPGRP